MEDQNSDARPWDERRWRVPDRDHRSAWDGERPAAAGWDGPKDSWVDLAVAEWDDRCWD